MMQKDTIAAISTALSNSGISIVRISGDNAFSIVDKIYRAKSGEKIISKQVSHTLRYGYIKEAAGNDIIDEALVSIMRAPHSYTMEDTVEINCHGGILVTQKVLEAVISAGARLAEPGEFTKRAFLNGRMDLSQAESVMDLISAKNEFARKNSMSQLQGDFGKEIRRLRSSILYEMAFIESALDDPEHYDLEGYGEKLLKRVEEIQREVEELLRNSERGELLKEGIKTVIIGKPNVGKSSLLNLFLGFDRAIVTDIPGTTRDTISEQVNLHGVTLNIIDTAGIRETEDLVEKIGVERSKERIFDSDLVLYVMDASEELDENDEEILKLIDRRTSIVLLNKVDLLQANEMEKLVRETQNDKMIPFSAKENLGMEALEETIKEMFFQGKIAYEEEIIVTNIRHKSALEEARKSLLMVEESIKAGMPEDFYTIDFMDAYEALGKIVGESVGEDLVNEIFSKFCMGK